MVRLNSENFSKGFLCLDILLFKSFRIFLNIHDFCDFFVVFRIKTFTATHKHVLCIIRFAVKFHIG